MGTRITQRTVLERLLTLTYAAKMHAQSPGASHYMLDLHDAALAYAAAVRCVARRDRDR